MKKISISLFLLFALASNISAQWDAYQIPSASIFDSIDALGESFAVTSSGDKIFITTDCGKTWTSKNLPSGVTGVVDISIANTNIFYITTSLGSFYKTVDGGDTWITIFSNPDLCGYGNYIEMFSETRGIAMGDGTSYSQWRPFFLRTTNGTDWIQMSPQIFGSSGDNWRRIDFVDENIGYFYESGFSPQKLMKTSDGGATWTDLSLPPVLVQVIKFFDADFGLVYANGTFYKTTDGGSSWVISATINPVRWGLDIEFLPGDRNKIWFANQGSIYYSSDGGSTWSTQASSPNFATFYDIVFTSKNVGWVLSRFGRVSYTSTNGGLAVSAGGETVLPTTFTLFQNFPNPFNPSTEISYQLPRGVHVTLKVYDMLGREVAVLADEFKNAGTHHSTFFTPHSSLTSGAYFYRLTAGDFSLSRKMILLK